MIENEELQSKTIKFLRFPLIIGIVFIHTNLAEVNIGGQLWAAKGQFPIHDIFRYIVSEELARIAVPLFYFMSGFLFFMIPVPDAVSPVIQIFLFRSIRRS